MQLAFWLQDFVEMENNNNNSNTNKKDNQNKKRNIQQWKATWFVQKSMGGTFQAAARIQD